MLTGKQQMLVAACGYCNMMFVIDWDKGTNYFYVSTPRKHERCYSVSMAKEVYEKMSKEDE